MAKGGFDISLDVSGWRELERALLDLKNDRTIIATMKRAMLQAAEPMAATARRLAPKRSRNLEEAIDVGVRLNKRQAAQRRSRGIIKTGSMVEVYVGAGKGGAHAVLEEFGTGIRQTKKGANRGSAAPHPFLRPAWEQHKTQVLRDFGVQLGLEIERAAKRAARKNQRKGRK